MKKIFLIFLFLQLPTLASTIRAQDSVLHLYVGASINGDRSSFATYEIDFGFGFEGGLKYRFLYLGLEYGMYGISPYYNTADPMIHYGPDDNRVGLEQYFGFHAGVIINNWLWVGAVMLLSTSTINHSDYDSAHKFFYGYQYLSAWFNVGPDLRFSPSEHFTLNFAYTIRRGLKIGGGYIF